MKDTIKNKLTTIAENQPKIKELGFNEGYSKGRTDEWSEFWKSYTNNGARMDYRCAFYTVDMAGVEIDANLCKPVSTGQIFYDSKMTELPKGINFSKRNPDSTNNAWPGPIGREFAHCTNIRYMYDIGIQPSASLAAMFHTCRSLETIEIIRSKEETIYDETFLNCNALKNITFDGVIGRNISFASSPLTVESMKNIILHLANYAGTSSEHIYTLTFKASVFQALGAEGATSPNGNTWAEYIDDLKWNITLA